MGKHFFAVAACFVGFFGFVGCAGAVEGGRSVVDVRDGVPGVVGVVEATGFVSGRICNHHVGAFVVGARVTVVDEAGVVVEGVTDGDGAFQLEVTTGLQTVTVLSDGFRKTFVADVTADADVSVQLDTDCSAD